MTDPREPYGRIVHEQRVAFESERSALKDRPGFILQPWEDRHPEQRELDMRIGAAVGAQALADAAPEPMTAAECDRLRQMAGEHGGAVKAVRKALVFARMEAQDGPDEAMVAAAWAALKVLSGEEGADHE